MLPAMANYVDKLQPAFTEAFSLAARGAADLAGHMSPDVENLAGWLFGTNEAEAQRRLGNVQRIPATFSTNIRDLSNLNDVVVYCNMDRYQTSNRPDGALYDPNTGSYLKLSEVDSMMCKTGQAIAGQRRPKAITANYPRWDTRKPPVLTTMDICNWYLEFVKSSQWATESDVESGSPTFPSLWGFLESLATTHQETFGRTRMDISALFEHTLLHELTHSDKVGTPQYEIPEAESYGWDKCVEAKSATNSDSLAFFALGCQFINQGYTIGSFGNIDSPSPSRENSPPRRRRTIVSRLWAS
ncbi:hypothetical protein ABVK25_003462 [Lepraria finkii]|uniref:Lysine-specific metallo-endopeptidase domain-containing protein n=1 Tax=Lepraria finkii TaxID=1340010 RepID=A0ABR4BF46_9LECA